MRQQKGLDLASEFLAQHWDEELPVDLIALASSAGVRIVLVDMVNDDGFHTAKLQKKHGQSIIQLRRDLVDPRRRYAIAHALALHLLIDSDVERVCTLFSYSNANPDPVAQQANSLALALLMPYEAVISAVRGILPPTLAKLATKFDVSEVAVNQRLQDMGILFFSRKNKARGY